MVQEQTHDGGLQAKARNATLYIKQN